MPWLALLAEAIRKHASADKPTVFACSALKRKYRDVLAAKAANCSQAHILFVSGSHHWRVSIC
jgi:gluconate kinase